MSLARLARVVAYAHEAYHSGWWGMVYVDRDDLDAALAYIAEARSMTAAEFRAWLARRHLTQEQAAALLAAKQPEVSRWLSGERPVPPRVVRIIELLDGCEQQDRPKEERC